MHATAENNGIIGSAAAARLLGLSYWQLRKLVTSGRIPAPRLLPAVGRRGGAGYAWTSEDLERARQARRSMVERLLAPQLPPGGREGR